MTDAPPSHFFVDEAGDPNLFNRRKEVTVGRDGCSQYFLLGSLEVADPDRLHNELEHLRSSLLRDPLVNTVPSMRPERGKTARAFHAKDDIPEVRHAVFKLLRQHDLTFRAVFLDKTTLVDEVRASNQGDASYRYNANHVYDRLVGVLFMGQLGRDGNHRVTFATRGKSDHTQALRTALVDARDWLQAAPPLHGPLEVSATTPHHSAGLHRRRTIFCGRYSARSSAGRTAISRPCAPKWAKSGISTNNRTFGMLTRRRGYRSNRTHGMEPIFFPRPDKYRA